MWKLYRKYKKRWKYVANIAGEIWFKSTPPGDARWNEEGEEIILDLYMVDKRGNKWVI